VVDIESFWQLVERARTATGPAADKARRDGQPSAVAEALVAELAMLPLTEVLAFDQILSDLVGQVDTWDVCAACWIIEYGFLSDDGFADFRAGLVGLGRSTFEAVIADPDSLAGHPAVQEISQASGRRLWIGDESLLFAAQRAYEQQTGDADAFWEAVEAAHANAARPTDGMEPVEDRWNLRDEAEWRRRLPRLAALFLSHRAGSGVESD
jgi:hypothetical protein